MGAPHTARSARNGVPSGQRDAADDCRGAYRAGRCDQVADPVRILQQLLQPDPGMRDCSDEESRRHGKREARKQRHSLPVEARKDAEDDREGQHAPLTIDPDDAFRNPRVPVKTIEGDGWRVAVPDGLVAREHKAFGYEGGSIARGWVGEAPMTV